MEDPSEGCYCIQAQACPHWIATKMDRRLETVKKRSHERTKTFEQELQQEDHRPIVSELQRELRTAMLEIERLAKTSRDLAKTNQELEETRMLAVSDQARTAKRLMLVSSQLEYTEEQLFNVTKEMNSGQKDSELLRIERIKRTALQEREDEGRIKIEVLQEELQEVQKSERTLQQKLSTVQTKYETLVKRHDNLKRQQHELELARESKEALAWLKETTDRLCSPPQGSLGQVIQQERSSLGSAAVSIHRSSPSSSPPHPSSFIDPPLAAQNQLISLIKELATTNSTLRSELNEYRDLLQDTRNEMLALRSQVEDYEQGHAFDNCCGSRIDDDDSLRTSKSAWSTLDVQMGGGLDAVSHIGTLGSVPGSPPHYMTAPRTSSRHHSHHHSQLSGVRGNVFGELERLYSQGKQGSSKHKGRSHSSKKSKRRVGGHQESSNSRLLDPKNATTVSISTSTSEIRRGSATIMTSSRSPLNPTPPKLRDRHESSGASPTSNASRSRRSMYTDADMDMLSSGSESVADDIDDRETDESAEHSSGTADSEDGQEEPGFVARFAEAEQPSERNSTEAEPSSQDSPRALSLLPPASLDDALMKSGDMMGDSSPVDLSGSGQEGSVKNQAPSISLLSAELQRATQFDTKVDLCAEGNHEQAVEEDKLHPLAQGRPVSFNLGQDAIVEDQVHEPSVVSWAKSGNSRFPQHEKSSSDQGIASLRQRRRLSEPLHSQPSTNSFPGTSKKGRPSSIYSLKRPRHRLESPTFNHTHSGHVASASLGGVSELQRCKSAELVEQTVVERRQRMMEAWRVGVVAAAVTQQQSIHSAVAFGEHRKDTDNISIRSKASRRRVKGSSAREANAKDGEGQIVGQDQEKMVENEAGPESQIAVEAALEPSRPPQEESDKDKKRRSVRSARSARSSLLFSPMGRSPLQARDRRFPSEASNPSEAFSHRRHDHEQTPYQLLHTLSAELLERLTRSDTRELNRRLQRTFDIQALSQLSNSVIENVLTDINNLGERFRWLEAQVADPAAEVLENQPHMAHSKVARDLDGPQEEDAEGDSEDDEEEGADWDFSVEEFFPLTHTVQEMLSEIGKLRMTINELQLSYVLKVEQDRIRAEKDFRQDLSSEDEEYEEHGDVDFRSNQTSDKPAQPRKLGMLDRPRILGSASTGVSGFFSKVFGGSGQPQNEDPKAPGRQKPAVDAVEAPREKPKMSKSKSGPVIAETSKIFAESAWISTPGIPAAPKSSDPPTKADGVRASGTGSILVPGSRLSATTSLAAMATMSYARSSTIYVPERPTTTLKVSSARTRAIDISFSPDVKQGKAIRSPSAVSPTAMSVHSQFSRSLPQDQSFDLLSSEGHPGTNVAPPSFQSASSILEDAKTPHAQSAAGPSELNPRIDTESGTPDQGQRSHTANITPHSIDMSARSGTLALNVVTKQDVFHEHWVSSPSSSLSAAVSTVPSRASSERRATGDSMPGGPVLVEPHKGGSPMASLSSNSVASDTTSTVASRLVSKPTLIARSALAVATPSTSTVSSPMSSTSWFDTRRYSVGPGQDTTASSEARLFDNHNPSTSGTISAFGSGLGSDATSGIRRTGAEQHQQHQFPKNRATISYHADAAAGGSNSSITQSLGRAGSRDSTLAFLRGEVQASSILGSLLQAHSPAQSRPPAAATWKGKGLASDSHFDSPKVRVEVLTSDFEDEESHESAMHGSFMRQSMFPSIMTPSRSDTALASSGSNTGATSTLTAGLSQRAAGLSQRAAVTSTAVTYIVATPDTPGSDDKDGSSRKKKAVFDRDLIIASQKRILAGIPHQDKPFVPEARPRRARALSIDSAQSTEPLKATEIMDLWRAGAGVSRDIWRGLIKKVDGRDS
ncbi:hypothetical protein EDD21DRAFT_386779 [Dissophora ornata]|nr:hypothetical protein BGZ58_011309 [Dissophora ornata]KAI8596951.1 hypothetical protein EDD21DRAFT_386779 [Dissophora ornata]